jgi:hypothetical protein
MPIRVFQDAGNTKTGGNVEGTKVADSTGQLPSVMTRRDSHGAATNINGDYACRSNPKHHGSLPCRYL